MKREGEGGRTVIVKFGGDGALGRTYAFTRLFASHSARECGQLCCYAVVVAALVVGIRVSRGRRRRMKKEMCHDGLGCVMSCAHSTKDRLFSLAAFNYGILTRD